MASTEKSNNLTMKSPSSDNTKNFPSNPSADVIVMKNRRYLQRQLGPAPFASFEDLSDEV